MNRASSATGWVRNPTMKSLGLDPIQASSYELGWTLNPITGCLNHVNGLCKGGGFPCYAYKLANGRLKQRYLANDNFCPTGNPVERGHARSDPFYPRFWPERLWDCWDVHNRQTPKGIFVCDMGELFGDWIPYRWQSDIFDVFRFTKQHRFYLLTKQPQNLIKFSPFPPNCFVGVTATNHEMFYEAMKHLSQIEATVKFISAEPLLGQIALAWLPLKAAGIKQVIIGAQTKPTVYPKIEWVEEIVKACDKAGVKVFLKDNLEPLFKALPTLPDWSYTEKGRRQELPE